MIEGLTPVLLYLQILSLQKNQVVKYTNSSTVADVRNHKLSENTIDWGFFFGGGSRKYWCKHIHELRHPQKTQFITKTMCSAIAKSYGGERGAVREVLICERATEHYKQLHCSGKEGHSDQPTLTDAVYSFVCLSDCLLRPVWMMIVNLLGLEVHVTADGYFTDPSPDHT